MPYSKTSTIRPSGRRTIVRAQGFFRTMSSNISLTCWKPLSRSSRFLVLQYSVSSSTFNLAKNVLIRDRKSEIEYVRRDRRIVFSPSHRLSLWRPGQKVSGSQSGCACMTNPSDGSRRMLHPFSNAIDSASAKSAWRLTPCARRPR